MKKINDLIGSIVANVMLGIMILLIVKNIIIPTPITLLVSMCLNFIVFELIDYASINIKKTESFPVIFSYINVLLIGYMAGAWAVSVYSIIAYVLHLLTIPIMIFFVRKNSKK